MGSNRNKSFTPQGDLKGKVRNDTNRSDKQPALTVVQLPPPSPVPRVEVDFKHLDDGRVVELVEDPADATKTKLAVLDGGKVCLTDAVDHHGQLLVPIGRMMNGLEDISLPSVPQPYKSTEEVFFRTSNVIAACVALPTEYLYVTAAFVLNSWFADRLRPPVYLMLTGLPQSGKTTLLETLRLLCRRALLVSDITSAAAYDACSRFGCTLLIDENDWRADQNSRAMRKQLRAGTSKGMLAKDLGKSRHAYGAKVLSSVELPDDAALRSRCIHIPMNESDQTDLRKPWDPQIVKAADSVRGQLLQFRLERYSSVFPRIIPGSEKLRPRSRDLLRSLAAPLKGEKLLEQLMWAFFMRTHDPSTSDLLSPAQAAVATALFQFIHMHGETGYLQIRTIADLANGVLKELGERITLNPRKCSDVLASLGFVHRVRSSQGSHLRLDKETLTKIHKLNRRRGEHWILPVDLKNEMDACKLCKDEP
jgi:hypothetical protein